MTVLRAKPGQEVKLGDKVYTANELGLVLVAPAEADILRAHGFLPVLNTRSDRDPNETDDGNAGHSVGSTWNNVVSEGAFVCLNSAPLAAVWKDVAGRDDAFDQLKIQLPPVESPAAPDGGQAGGDADQPPAAITDTDNDGGGLLGSSMLPSVFLLEGDTELQLGTVVAEAHKRSGLSVKDWNAQTEEQRDHLISLVVGELPLKLPTEPTINTGSTEGENTATTAANPEETKPETDAKPDGKPEESADAGAKTETTTAQDPLVESKADNDGGGTKTDKTLEERLIAAAETLNHADDAHWTKDGLPNVNVLAELTGAQLTRVLVTQVLGAEFVRKKP